MRKILCILALLSVTLTLAAVEKTKLRVLYVGGHSDIETFGNPYDTTAHQKGIVTRTLAWKTYLEQYFTTVKAIQGAEYNYKLSYDYDVTIIDGTPQPLIPQKNYYRNGRLTEIKSAKYFPEAFDLPVITIAEVGETVGRALGSKNDWYCLCLTGKAFNLQRNNPIFKGPYPVKITLHDEPTPDGAKDFAKMMGDKLPATTPMWTVHYHDYLNTPNHKVGMVSREWGYTDSPDAEIISGGKSAKSYDAVAIGRHANFLSWGFAGSPADMTEEAKNVFANAVVYMSKFRGHHIIARKLNENINTRFSVDQMICQAKRQTYDDYAAFITESNKQMLHVADSLQKVKAAGGKIESSMSIYLGITADQLQPVSTYEQYLQQTFGELCGQFGTDASKYEAYYRANKPYFYGDLHSYAPILDTDAQSLGIANNDLQLLYKALSLWESGKDVEKAKRILYRYTLLRYDNPKPFREWLKKYAKKLFFSESGCWKWLVNDLTPGIPGNDYSVLLSEDSVSMSSSHDGAQVSAADPVALSSTLERSGNDCELTVYVTIFPGYHIYNVVSDKDPYIPTTYTFAGEGFTLEGAMQKPIGMKLDSNGSLIYEGTVALRQKFKAQEHGKMKVTVSYQACNANACLMPATKDVEISF